MEFVVEFENNAIYLVLPPTERMSALFFACSSGLTSRALPELAFVLNREKAVRVCLPVSVWRNVLDEIHQSVSSDRDSDAPVPELSWAAGGVQYSDPADIPAPPDFYAQLGSFNAASGHLQLCDPRVDAGPAERLVVPSLPGRWHAKIELADRHTGMGVSNVILAHNTVPLDPLLPRSFPDRPIGTVSVESTLCGIFDNTEVPLPGTELRHAFNAACWRATTCRSRPSVSTRDFPASCLPGGPVVSAIDGDGTYGCYALLNAEGAAVALCLALDRNVCEPEE